MRIWLPALSNAARAHALVEAIEGRMLGDLTEGERARLLAVLRNCADALERQ